MTASLEPEQVDKRQTNPPTCDIEMITQSLRLIHEPDQGVADCENPIPMQQPERRRISGGTRTDLYGQRRGRQSITSSPSYSKHYARHDDTS